MNPKKELKNKDKGAEDRPTFNVNIRPYVVVRTVFLAIMTVVALMAVTKMRQPITLILTSFFLAIALNPPVNKISRFMPKGSRALSVAVAYLIVVGILGTLIFTVVPPVTKQIGNFANSVPEYIDDIKGDRSTKLTQFIEKYGLEDEAEKLGNQVQEKLGNSGELVFNSAQTAFSALLSTITILVLTFFMLVDGPIMLNRLFAKYKDDEVRRRHKNLLKRMYKIVTGYFNGQVIISSINAALALVAMLAGGWIFKSSIPYPLVLTAVVWICGLIPLIGASLGAAVVVFVSAFINWKLAVALAIYFFIYQQTENATIQPKIQSKAVSMSPLIVLVVVLLSASVGGLFAAFIALPVAGCLQVLFNDFLAGGSLTKAEVGTPDNWISRLVKTGNPRKLK